MAKSGIGWTSNRLLVPVVSTATRSDACCQGFGRAKIFRCTSRGCWVDDRTPVEAEPEDVGNQAHGRLYLINSV
jgi:hypothetical protein